MIGFLHILLYIILRVFLMLELKASTLTVLLVTISVSCLGWVSLNTLTEVWFKGEIT
jgi:hypothetical protein